MATKESLIKEVEERNSEIDNLTEQIEIQKQTHEEEIIKIKEESRNQENIWQLKIDELQKQLNIRELKKLAEAYEKQENQYNLEEKKWFKFVLVSFVLLAITVFISVYISNGKMWYERIEYYIFNFVTITLLIFSMKQYSYYVKLKTDYANRRTIAQSYHNILTSEEDKEIRSNFLDKASDILAAKSEVEHESYTLPEKLIETLGEIAKNLSNK